MPFFPNSALAQKIILEGKRACETPISTMSAVIFWASLDFEKNCYSRTASYVRWILKSKKRGNSGLFQGFCFLESAKMTW